MPITCEDDGNECTYDECRVVNNAAVCHEKKPFGTPCDDDNACTENEHCLNSPVCGGATSVDCDDESECTEDSCDSQSGCVNTNLCEDDENECTDDSCNPEIGCLHTPNTNPCSDGNYCTINDHCLNGVCQDTDPRICPDANNADGDICNGREICDEEEDACVRVEVLTPCNDNDPCTDDKCDPIAGCVTDCFEFPDEWKLDEADDRTFVGTPEDDQQEGDERVVVGYSTDFSIDVTRYAGETNGDGTLKHAAQLVENELAGEFAELEITTFGASGTSCDRVFFNGQSVHTLAPDENPTDCLEGSGCSWATSKFKIPIGKVKFPASRGSNGAGPTARPNFIGIDFALSPSRSCIKVSGAVLRVKLMSPIVLIHGNGSSGPFFVRQGFTLGLDGAGLVWDNSISMITDTRAVHARDLRQPLRIIPADFGVDSVHIIAHSKGGLDTREYLERFYPYDRFCFSGNAIGDPCSENAPCPDPDAVCRKPFELLSFTTLSTPHDGSVLADIVVSREYAASQSQLVLFSGIPEFANVFARISEGGKGFPDLQTTTCALFNQTNVPFLNALSPRPRFFAVGADADKNADERVNADTDACFGVVQIIGPDEVYGLQLEDSTLRKAYFACKSAAAELVDIPYQIIRETKAVSVSFTTATVGGVPVWVFGSVNSIPTGGPKLNDTLVTINSALGKGGYKDVLDGKAPLVRGLGRNHATIANADMATMVLEWIKTTEKDRGDLR